MITEVEKPKKQNEITLQVLSRLEKMKSAGEIRMPENYSPENALQSAQLHLAELKDKNGKPVLEVCSKESIANALLKMVVQGLSVIKNQCYFIAYGSQLNFQRSYFGTICLGKRVAGVVDVVPVMVYDGDDFEFGYNIETGYRHILKHIPSWKNVNNSKILAAYAIVHFSDGKKQVEFMTISEIEDAWNMGTNKGGSPAHKNFRQEMAKKTVINRALKIPINSSDDSHLLFDEDYNDDSHVEDVHHEEVEEPKTISMKTESGTIEIKPENYTDKVKTPEPEIQKPIKSTSEKMREKAVQEESATELFPESK